MHPYYCACFSVLQRNSVAILLTLLLLVGLALRLIGIDFGLPYLMHPDEDAVIMPAINILKTGDWAPTRMEYGTFHIYLLTVVFTAVYALAARGGHIASVDQLTLFERGTIPAIYEYPEYFVAARIVSAVFGTLTILIIYMLGQRLGGRRQGLIAAAIAAFLPALVVNDHFATTDSPLMFWVTLSLYLLLRAYDNWEVDSLWAYAGAGFVCGLATSTKYNGMVLILPLLLVPILRARSLDELLSLRFMSGPLMMLGGFLAGTPYAALDLPKFLHWFGYSLHLYNAPDRVVTMPVWLWHLRHHLTNPHMPVIVMGVIGAVLSFRYWGWQQAVILNSFAILLWLAILGQTNAQTRMWLPAAPLFVLWTAWVIDMLIQKLSKWLVWRQLRPHWAYLPLILLLLPLFNFSLYYAINFQRDDVRTVAREWVEVNIPPGSTIAIDYFHPNLDPTVWSLTRTFYIFEHDIEWYKQQGVEYLILNEALTDFGQHPPEAYERYRALLQDVCEVGAVHGPFVATTMFDIKIYRVEGCRP
jgi:hypothetical protein